MGRGVDARARVGVRHLPVDGVAAGLAVALALTSAALGLLVLGGSADVLYAGLGLAGVLLTVRRRTTAALVVWLVASLLRPEAVLLAAVTLVIALRSDARGTARRRAVTVYAVGALLAAAAWLAVGGLGGDPLVGLHSATGNAELNGDPRGPVTALTTVASGLAGPTGWWTVLAAAAATLVAAVTRVRHGPTAEGDEVRSVAMFVAVGGVAYLGQGVLGTPLVARYLLLPALLCVVLAAGVVPLVRGRVAGLAPALRRTAAGAVVIALLAGAVASAVPQWHDVRAATSTRAAVLASADVVLDAPLVRGCPGPVVVRSPAVAAVVALRLDRPLRDVELDSRAGAGVLLQPLTLEAAELAGYGPLTPPAQQAVFPSDAPPRLQDAHWAVYSSCVP